MAVSSILSTIEVIWKTTSSSVQCAYDFDLHALHIVSVCFEKLNWSEMLNYKQCFTCIHFSLVVNINMLPVARLHFCVLLIFEAHRKEFKIITTLQWHSICWNFNWNMYSKVKMWVSSLFGEKKFWINWQESYVL